jgi:mannose-P-dolichol utilization defect protein 1
MQRVADLVASSGLLSASCSNTLLVDLDVTSELFAVLACVCLTVNGRADVPCIKLLISRALSILIIVGSFGLKVPQLLALWKAQSAKGMSKTMFLAETVVFAVSGVNGVRKGFPLTTYLENWVILVQVVGICLLLFHFAKQPLMSVLYLAGLAGLLAGLFSVPAEYVEALISISIVLVVVSRVPQIKSNWDFKDTGALSFASFALSFGGGLARVFTTLQEAPSLLVLLGFAVGVTLNGIIMTQIYLYSGKQKTKKQ